MSNHRGPTIFTRFRTAAPFDLRLSVFEAGVSQRNDGSKDYFTRNRIIRQQVLSAGGPVRVMAEGVRFRCLPAEHWARDYGRQRVMFVLPSDALGDTIGVVLFLRAFRHRFPQATVTVANTGAATDIFRREDGIRLLPLVVSEKELEQHHPIIDLGEVNGWDTIVLHPVDVETELLQRFGLAPVEIPVRPVPSSSPAIAILPMASSPLRTLPPPVTAAIATALVEMGRVRVVLNAYQGVKAAYERTLLPLLPAGVEVLPGFGTTGGLLDFMAVQDFVVAADSGPAHLTKLFGTAGTAAFTSASGEVLQGRHSNLGRWQVPFSGPHCVAPCGLAKLRAAEDGRVGCMGSLKRPLAELPNLPSEAQATLAEKLIVSEQVPCVAELSVRKDELVAHVMDRFRGQIS